MGYRKFKADFIFDGSTLQSSNNILITNEEGVIKTIVDEQDAGSDIEVFNGILGLSKEEIAALMESKVIY